MNHQKKYIFIASLISVYLLLIFISNQIMSRSGSLNDLEVKINTKKEEYQINETFYATISFVNDKPYNLIIPGINNIQISANSLNNPNPTLLTIDISYDPNHPFIDVPANSDFQFYTIQCQSKYLGEFYIDAFGVRKNIIIVK